MTLEMTSRSALPCSLRTFLINNKEAYAEDFGYCRTWGSAIDYGCCNIFIPNKIPSPSLLEEYNISENDYREICNKLEYSLQVYGCGWCS